MPPTAHAELLLALIRGDWERAEELHRAALAIDPDFSVKRWGQSQTHKDRKLVEQLMNDLRQAGLPY